jgi:hypothetical protein
MSAGPLLRILTIAGLLISLSARALAAEDEPEGGGSSIAPAETATVQAPPPVAAPPPKRIVELEERTAYMVGEHRLKLGILAFEYGLLRQLSVGTDPPSWALRAFTSVLVPNLHLKLQIFDRDPVAVAVQAAGY